MARVTKQPVPATLVGAEGRFLVVHADHPNSPFHLEPSRVFLGEEAPPPGEPVEGYIVYATSPSEGFWTFFSNDFEHGEL